MRSQADPPTSAWRTMHGLDRVAPERANFRSALRWSIDAGEGALALRPGRAPCGACGTPSGRWRMAVSSRRRPWPCRGPAQRAGPRLGAGRGRKSGLLAGRRGDGPRPLRSSDRGRRGRRRRRVHRRCVLQLRPSRVHRRRSDEGPDAPLRPRSWTGAIGIWATSAALARASGVRHPGHGRRRADEAADSCERALLTFERLGRSAVPRDDRRQPRWAAFAGGDVPSATR